MVFSGGTPFGKSLGRTFTPLPPTSWLSLTNALVFSIAFSTAPGSGR